MGLFWIQALRKWIISDVISCSLLPCFSLFQCFTFYSSYLFMAISHIFTLWPPFILLHSVWFLVIPLHFLLQSPPAAPSPSVSLCFSHSFSRLTFSKPSFWLCLCRSFIPFAFIPHQRFFFMLLSFHTLPDFFFLQYFASSLKPPHFYFSIIFLSSSLCCHYIALQHRRDFIDHSE